MTGQQIDRDHLRELAENATPGPWESLRDTAWGDEYPSLSIQRVGESWDSDPAHPCCEPLEEADAAFIAAAREALPQLLDQLDAAEQRIRDLTQEVGDERAACLDQMEQVRIRDARIKAVEDVLDRWELAPDAQRPFRVTAKSIRRALDGER